MKTKSSHLDEINKLLSEYLKEIDNSGLKPLSAKIYQTQSVNFVRWINGDFTPGDSRKITGRAVKI